MSLAPGARLGSYEVIGAIGAGGMGEVYRAKDTSLKRTVAIKVLPDSVSADPDRLTRFQREAEVLASLNHPNIAQVYGLEKSTATTALVMELVEGPTLADRIAHGAIPLAEALPIAKQIAEALEAAHEQGIIHRDLKPANIKVRDDGTVKVLDFGLAKALEPRVASTDVADSPTTMSPAMTHVGVILGTAAYMAPEQAKGRPADKRTDIWAFGCVLYEMLTGTRAFAGEDVADTLANVLKRDPDWTTLPADTPSAIRLLLRRCLERDRRRRIGDAAAALLVLDDPNTLQTGHAGTDDATAKAHARALRRRTIVTVAGGVGLASLISAAVWFEMRAAPAPELRVDIVTPPTTDPVSFALAPDGRAIVFVAPSDGRSRLWLRRLDAATTGATVLHGTDGARRPFWSPDSQAIGFFASFKLKAINADDSGLRTLADAPADAGGTWNHDNVIVFAATPLGALSRVSAVDGAVVQVAQPVAGQLSNQIGPQFLPDGRHFLYFNQQSRVVLVGQLDGGEGRRITEADVPAVFAPPAHLLLVRQGTLYALRFNPDTLAPTGDPKPVAGDIAIGTRSSAGVSAGADVLAYRTGRGRLPRQFVWRDRTGSALQRVGEPAVSVNPNLSPNGHTVAFARVIGERIELATLDVNRGFSTAVADAPPYAQYPVWSPEGTRLAYYVPRTSGGSSIVTMDLKGGPAASLSDPKAGTTSGPEIIVPKDWWSDRLLINRAQVGSSAAALWIVNGDGGWVPLTRGRGHDTAGQFSPNGQWVAYQSDESGRMEVYLQSVTTPDLVPVSTTGGEQPRWCCNGRKLFYVALDGRLMEATIDLSAPGKPKIVSTVPLFMTNIGPADQGLLTHQYMAAQDGQRFLMNEIVDEPNQPPITLILNWRPR